MSVLRAIETRIEGLFEGVFGRAFRTHVQPVELARKLAKEMDEHRSVSVSRVYVPNEYTVYLSPGDRTQFAPYEGSLVGELQEYLTEHARREAYATLTPPRVLLQTDDDLAIGEFGIATRVAQPDELLPQRRRRGRASSRRRLVSSAPRFPCRPRSKRRPSRSSTARARRSRSEAIRPRTSRSPSRSRSTLTVAGRVVPVSGGRVVVGRSRECDIRVDDGNVSRRHVELVQRGIVHVDRARPRLDERHRGQRSQGAATHAARRRRPDHDREHRASLRARRAVSVALTVDETLLGLKIAFLVLLYLFVWLVVRSATRGLSAGAPQESIILPARRGGGPAREPRAVDPACAGPREPCDRAGHRDRARTGGGRRARRRERDPARRRHDRLEPPRDARQPRRRAVGRGRRLDERDVRQRRARRPRAGCSSPAT